MNVTITREHKMEHVTGILLIHESGLQIRITPGYRSFIVEPGVPVEVRRRERLAWEVVAAPEGCGASSGDD